MTTTKKKMIKSEKNSYFSILNYLNNYCVQGIEPATEDTKMSDIKYVSCDIWILLLRKHIWLLK